jgi:hypothetical protein
MYLLVYELPVDVVGIPETVFPMRKMSAKTKDTRYYVYVTKAALA